MIFPTSPRFTPSGWKVSRERRDEQSREDILALTMIKVRSWMDIGMQMMVVVGSIGRHRSQTNTTIYCGTVRPPSPRENMFGPLGISIAPYVRSSRSLYKWVKPIASWYANLAGYRKMGLRYDDLRTIFQSLAPLPASLTVCTQLLKNAQMSNG